jgi:hypothetical protein
MAVPHGRVAGEVISGLEHRLEGIRLEHYANA